MLWFYRQDMYFEGGAAVILEFGGNFFHLYFLQTFVVLFIN